MSTAFPTLSFRLSSLPSSSSSKFSPRIGHVTLSRPVDGGGCNIEIPTPGIMSCTTRGVIQHLSRDNVQRTPSIRWVHVPFESFLQIDPPIPTLQRGLNPLHTFLGFPPERMVVSMSLRDPADGREMPPNGKLFVAAQSSRGARKVTCPAYRSYVAAVMPDIVFPMSDVLLTPAPHSQKRISKSIERSTQWLASVLAPLNPEARHTHSRLNVFLHMVGGIKPAARVAFAATLQEPLEQKEKELLAPLETLDEGVSGYAFDLVPLRRALSAETASSTASPHGLADELTHLIRASLTDLPATKPRLVSTAFSPHEVLALIRDAGIDLFDTSWAQRAAAWGVALDFCFPAPRTHAGAPRGVGHNLYEEQYAHDFGRLAADIDVCKCGACAPTWANAPLVHSAEEASSSQEPQRAGAYTRAYLHHLLHTHEMSAHALLVMHNLTVVEAFMRNVRGVLRSEMEAGTAHSAGGREPGSDSNERGGDQDRDVPTLFAAEVARFEQTYDGALRVLDEARECWMEVDRARGKGRLARERARKAAEDIDVDVTIGAQTDVEELEG